MGSSSSSRSGCLQQQLAQRDPAALTAGELGDVGVRRRAAQRVHGQLELGVDVPGVGVVELLLELAHLLHQLVGVVGRHLLGDLVEPRQLGLGLGDRLLDVAEHGLGLVERRLLGQHADGVAGHQPGLAVARLVQPGHDPAAGWTCRRRSGRPRRSWRRAGSDSVTLSSTTLSPCALRAFSSDVDVLGHGAAYLPVRAGLWRTPWFILPGRPRPREVRWGGSG